MSLMQDIVKMNFVRSGYLPNYPYHMISNAEMCNAFLAFDHGQYSGYMVDRYPCVGASLEDKYQILLHSMHEQLLNFLENDGEIIPDWIYSYMVGSTVGPNSNVYDIHDLLVLLDADNIDDVFTEQAAEVCLKVSSKWLSKLPSGGTRPPSMFGEPHVIKSLRLAQVNLGRS